MGCLSRPMKNLLPLFCLWASSAVAAGKPNVIIVMTDDMGYSDLGCFGSEIQTPNVDALAAKGLRFSQFYNFGKCCPTRAGLMTGLYSHLAGVGGMTRDERIPGLSRTSQSTMRDDWRSLAPGRLSHHPNRKVAPRGREKGLVAK